MHKLTWAIFTETDKTLLDYFWRTYESSLKKLVKIAIGYFHVFIKLKPVDKLK
jgi:hypothetical protein